jgi:hypothetical protein
MVNLKIISQGTPNSTRLINAETDAEIAGVSRIEWHCDVETGRSWAVVTILGVAVETSNLEDVEYIEGKVQDGD